MQSKIIINNTAFLYNLGLKVLKTKYQDYDKCPIKTDDIEHFWNEIEELKFEDIALEKNLELRRVMMDVYGIEKLTSKLNSVLVDQKIIDKTTSYVDSDGNIITKEFKDIYSLYKVPAADLDFDWNPNNKIGLAKGWNHDDLYYVECYCTSTNRRYLIWVSLHDINNTYKRYWKSEVTAIEAIAWTITTNVRKEYIDKIVRQGDCIMIKVKGDKIENKMLENERHLTADEYLTKLVAES